MKPVIIRTDGVAGATGVRSLIGKIRLSGQLPKAIFYDQDKNAPLERAETFEDVALHRAVNLKQIIGEVSTSI